MELLIVLVMVGGMGFFALSTTGGMRDFAQERVVELNCEQLELKASISADLTQVKIMNSTRWDWYLSQSKALGGPAPGEAKSYVRLQLVPGSSPYWNALHGDMRLLQQPY